MVVLEYVHVYEYVRATLDRAGEAGGNVQDSAGHWDDDRSTSCTIKQVAFTLIEELRRRRRYQQHVADFANGAV